MCPSSWRTIHDVSVSIVLDGFHLRFLSHHHTSLSFLARSLRWSVRTMWTQIMLTWKVDCLHVPAQTGVKPTFLVSTCCAYYFQFKDMVGIHSVRNSHNRHLFAWMKALLNHQLSNHMVQAHPVKMYPVHHVPASKGISTTYTGLALLLWAQDAKCWNLQFVECCTLLVTVGIMKASIQIYFPYMQKWGQWYQNRQEFYGALLDEAENLHECNMGC